MFSTQRQIYIYIGTSTLVVVGKYIDIVGTFMNYN